MSKNWISIREVSDSNMSILDASSLATVIGGTNGHVSQGSLSSCVNIERDHDHVPPVKQTSSNKAKASEENHVDRKDTRERRRRRPDDELETTQGNQVDGDTDVSGIASHTTPTSTCFFVRERKSAIQAVIKYLESLPPDQSFRKELTDYQFWKSVRAEFLSTFLFVLFTTHVSLQFHQSIDRKDDIQGHKFSPTAFQQSRTLENDASVPSSTLVIGFVTAALMYMTCNRIKKYRSCHLNPSLTFALFVTRHHDDHKHRHVSLLKLVFFVVVQLLASIVASVILFGLTFSHSEQTDPGEGSSQQLHLTSRTYNNNVSSSHSFASTSTTISSSLSVPIAVPGFPASNLFGLEFFSSFIVILVYFSVTDPSSLKQTSRSRRHDKDGCIQRYSRIKKRDQEKRNEVEERELLQRNQGASLEEGTTYLNEVGLRDEDQDTRAETQHETRIHLPKPGSQVRDDSSDLEASSRSGNIALHICHDVQNHSNLSLDRMTEGEGPPFLDGGEEAEKQSSKIQRQDAHFPKNESRSEEEDLCLRSRKRKNRSDSRNTTGNHRDSKSLFSDSDRRKKILTRIPETHSPTSGRKNNNNSHYCFAFVGFAISAAHLFSVRNHDIQPFFAVLASRSSLMGVFFLFILFISGFPSTIKLTRLKNLDLLLIWQRNSKAPFLFECEARASCSFPGRNPLSREWHWRKEVVIASLLLLCSSEWEKRTTGA